MAKFVETAGTLTNTTATLSAKDRNGLIVANPSDTVMTVRFGGTADASTGVVLAAGANITLRGRDAPDDSVSIFCAGTSKAYTAYEW
jgi:hypothetical protein